MRSYFLSDNSYCLFGRSLGVRIGGVDTVLIEQLFSLNRWNFLDKSLRANALYSADF